MIADKVRRFSQINRAMEDFICVNQRLILC